MLEMQNYCKEGENIAFGGVRDITNAVATGWTARAAVWWSCWVCDASAITAIDSWIISCVLQSFLPVSLSCRFCLGTEDHSKVCTKYLPV